MTSRKKYLWRSRRRKHAVFSSEWISNDEGEAEEIEAAVQPEDETEEEAAAAAGAAAARGGSSGEEAKSAVNWAAGYWMKPR